MKLGQRYRYGEPFLFLAFKQAFDSVSSNRSDHSFLGYKVLISLEAILDSAKECFFVTPNNYKQAYKFFSKLLSYK